MRGKRNNRLISRKAIAAGCVLLLSLQLASPLGAASSNAMKKTGPLESSMAGGSEELLTETLRETFEDYSETAAGETEYEELSVPAADSEESSEVALEQVSGVAAEVAVAGIAVETVAVSETSKRTEIAEGESESGIESGAEVLRETDLEVETGLEIMETESEMGAETSAEMLQETETNLQTKTEFETDFMSETETEFETAPMSETETTMEPINEVQNAVVDDSTIQYLEKNLNPNYAMPEKIELVNIICVKQTLADASKVAAGEGIDDILASENYYEKYLTMLSNFAAVYDIDENSDYYVAVVDTMHDDRKARVTEAVFASNDTSGNVIDDCIYDFKTGIAYLAKKEYLDAKNRQILANLQIQLLQLVDLNSLKSTVTVTTEIDGDSDTDKMVVDMFAENLQVKTEANLDEDQMIVTVNGVPLDDAKYTYDYKTGEIDIPMSSAAVQSVAVTVEEESLWEKVVDSFAPIKAKAMSSYDEMKPLLTDIVLPDWVGTGTYFTGEAPYAYTGEGSTNNYPNNTYAYVNGSASYTTDELIKELEGIVYNGGSLNLSKINEIKSGMYLRFSFYKRSAEFTYSGKDIYAKLSSKSEVAGSPMDWSQFGEKILRLACGHISTPLLGSYSGAQYNGVNYSLLPWVVRFLKVDRKEGFAIIGVLTASTHTQEGVGLFKVKLANPVYEGSLHVVKRDTALTSSGKVKPLAGVKFTLRGDDGKVYTKTTDTKGEIKFDQLKAQHYVLTEVETLPGYQLIGKAVDIKIPLELTKDQADKRNLELSKAIYDSTSKKYHFYDLTYYMKNGTTFDIPFTGAGWGGMKTMVAIAVVMLIGGACGILRHGKEDRIAD